MTGAHCGSHHRIVPRAPRGDASPDNAQAALNRPRDGPDSSLFLQPASPLAIVQTYSAVQAVPKGSTIEPQQQHVT